MKRVVGYVIVILTIFLSYQNPAVASTAENPEVLNVAILGLGGRVQDLLVECLKLKDQVHKEIRVVAVCDDHAHDSFNFYMNMLCTKHNPLADDYRDMFAHTSFYPDNSEGLSQLFEHHTNLDRVFITSPNNRHLTHINSTLAQSSCKNIFIEKPIFKTLSEFTNFNADTNQASIHVGLTLRYAMMTKIAEQKLKEYKAELGQLQKVTSWEHVNFSHAYIILMNWRRYRSLSGGLLLEKSIHDLDLALFFMQAVGANPKSVAITTQVTHDFFKKSRKDEILAHLAQDEPLRKKVEWWDGKPLQHIIPFSYDDSKAIDWKTSFDAFFKEFPDDDDFTQSDIIPDHHTLLAKIQTSNDDAIDFELDVKFNEFALLTNRGTHFAFKNGNVAIDIENGKMFVNMDTGAVHEFDLNAHGQRHAGGDVFVAHTMLGTLPEGHNKTTFDDPAVQLATVMGMVSEQQASNNSKDTIHLTQVDGQWVVDMIR